MKKFFQKVDKRSREEMTQFLEDHFRYDTMNNWNRSTSYACNMKIYNLGFSREIEGKLWELIDCADVYDPINDLIAEFGEVHDYLWQAGFNGRSGGYLVLYQGGRQSSGHKSYCKFCGQRNFSSVKETGNVCGRCNKPGRIDYVKPPMQIFSYPGRAIDMDEDFDSWSMEELKERAKLVQEFDLLADRIVEEAIYIAENYHAEEEVYFVPTSRKVLAEGGAV